MSERGSVVDMDCVSVCLVGQVGTAVWGADQSAEAASSVSSTRADIRHEGCAEACWCLHSGGWLLTRSHATHSWQPWSVQFSCPIQAPRRNAPVIRFLISALYVLFEDDDWVRKCIEYEVEGPRPRGRPKRTWREVVEKDCQARKLNEEDAIDRSKWRKLIKDVRWSGWVCVGECFFWYHPTRVVPDRRLLNCWVSVFFACLYHMLSQLSYFFTFLYLSPPLLFSFQNRPAPFPGLMS